MTVYQTDKLLDVFILCTRASHRGRGLAGQLVKTALENAKSEAEFPTPEVEVRSGLVLAPSPALLYLKQPAKTQRIISCPTLVQRHIHTYRVSQKKTVT